VRQHVSVAAPVSWEPLITISLRCASTFRSTLSTLYSDNSLELQTSENDKCLVGVRRHYSMTVTAYIVVLVQRVRRRLHCYMEVDQTARPVWAAETADIYSTHTDTHMHAINWLPRDAARLCRSMSSVRPSVCLSVAFMYRDRIGWNTSKIISRPNSLVYLLTLTLTSAIWSNGNTAKIRME